MKSKENLYSLILKQRRLYVEKANEQVVNRNIRLLKQKIHGLDETSFDQAVNLLSHFDKPLQSLIYSSLFNYLGIFSDIFCPEELAKPLWLQLVRDNKSSRKLSIHWSEKAQSLFKAFGISLEKDLHSVESLETLYALGVYAPILDMVKSNRKGDSVFWTLKTMPNLFVKDQFIELVENLSDISMEQKSLLKAKYAVSIFQKKIDLPNWKMEVPNWRNLFDKKILFGNKFPSHIHIQLLNSFNYCALISKEKEQVKSNFKEIEKHLAKIQGKTKDHLEGIYHFHQFIAYGSNEKSIHHLLEAIQKDKGFFDYYYRLGNIFYESNAEVAKACFEIAVATSPLTLEVVNDYDFFLSEHHPKERKSFTDLILGLGLFKEEDFNE